MTEKLSPQAQALASDQEKLMLAEAIVAEAKKKIAKTLDSIAILTDAWARREYEQKNIDGHHRPEHVHKKREG